jgi:hypothetical protein
MYNLSLVHFELILIKAGSDSLVVTVDLIGLPPELTLYRSPVAKQLAISKLCSITIFFFNFCVLDYACFKCQNVFV